MAAILALLAPIFSDLIKRIFPDPTKQAEAQQQMQQLLNQAQIEANKKEMALNENKKDIITTEMNVGKWAGQWRSYLMMVCIAIVGYNWIVVSLLNAFLKPLGLPIEALSVPPELWTLVTVGLGGYIGKETMQSYSDSRVQKAKIENNAIDEKILANKLRETLFPNGMTQAQWDAIRTSAQASIIE